MDAINASHAGVPYALRQWLREVLNEPDAFDCHRLAGDASARQYYRLIHQQESYIVMIDQDNQQLTQFLTLSQGWREYDLNVPEIKASHPKSGFVLLSDLGTTHYADVLKLNNATALYTQAFKPLIRLAKMPQTDQLPLFDRLWMREELSYFETWFLEKHLLYRLSDSTKQLLKKTFSSLINSIESQPYVVTHRDYHSRNLMYQGPAHSPGILDYQGAVWGPILYDAASLLRDAYCQWPEEDVTKWALLYRRYLQEECLIGEVDVETYLYWFDTVSIQRHLKILGIFARLAYRDGKVGYLKHIPVIFDYIQTACARHDIFNEFSRFMKDIACDVPQ